MGPTLNSYVSDMNDHHVFRINRHPYLLLTCGRWEEHYHQPTDTPDKLNYEKIASIAAYLANLATAASREEMAGPFEGYDSTDTELHFLRKTVQPVIERMGLDLKLENRYDVDRLVNLMISRFGL
jgi:hypothetical protein